MKIRNLFELLFQGKRREKEKKQEQRKPTPYDILPELAKQVENGRLVLPESMTEIPDRMFLNFESKAGNKPLVSVVIPGTVRHIGERAFEGCKNLEEVILGEGVESMGWYVFSGCTNLKRIQLPASLKGIDGWAFYGSEFAEPVFSADGKALIHYPRTWTKEEYIVPEGVEVIKPRAFIDADELKHIQLPQSLKRICSWAFYDTGFSEIVIPKDTVIEVKAFDSFKHPLRIIREKELDVLEEKVEYCYSLGASFLCKQPMRRPEEPYWKEDAFCELARQCAQGSTDAMEQMEDAFMAKAERAQSEEDKTFYRCAAQFWRMRAYRYGSERARQALLAWCLENPDSRMTSPSLDERLRGYTSGENLNALGFLFFEEDRGYSLGGLDAQGVVEVSAWAGDDGPDEDGYGREEYYDWWYLDEYLTLPEGVDYIHSYSNHDKRCNKERFKALHDQVAARRGERN